MSEIVERLRAAGKPMALDDKVWQTITVSSGASIFDEAASTITALQERVNVLEGLVRGFAALQLTNVNGGTDNALMQTDRLTAAPLVLSARTALGEKQ